VKFWIYSNYYEYFPYIKYKKNLFVMNPFKMVFFSILTLRNYVTW